METIVEALGLGVLKKESWRRTCKQLYYAVFRVGGN